ncbi:MAG: 30S ribosomal protein S12 methylthiotransferase RimO [Chloroflexi bacterium]|nr:30S ribosomal protein S12 methylthiotransferase RimO [Chloroflexota bacterium]
MVRFYIDTRGCPKNTVDSEALQAVLQAAGHAPVNSPAAADVLIVNTCGFIDVAKQESIDRLLELGQQKRPGQRLIAAGCLSQRYPEEVAADIPEVDFMTGIDAWRTLPAALEQLGTTQTAQLDDVSVPAVPSGSLLRFPATLPVLNQWPELPRKGTGPTAYIKISEGCNYGCTFCAIPVMKGLYRSKPLSRILQEAKELASRGVKEVVLVSQDSTAYGLDMRNGTSLITLLSALAEEVPSLLWVRVLYFHPDRLTHQFIDQIAAIPTFCPYVDLPLQHVHPDILRRMRRGHLIERTEEHIAHFREVLPHAAIRTTFIVGFPGERRAEFEFLLEWTQRRRFDRLGVFCYSLEEGTSSAEMADQVPLVTREHRRKKLLAIQEKISLEIQQRLIGTTLDVLIEGSDDQSRPRYSKHASQDGWSVGRSTRDAPEVDGIVLVRGRQRIGSIVPVRIHEATAYDLIGEVL